MNLEKIFKMQAAQLKKALHDELARLGYDVNIIHEKAQFLYAEGTAPFMLVAHLDTVHKDAPEIICYSADGNFIMSPQGIGGDDRCGVYIILSLIEKLSFKPYILFTMGEETGGIGASAFATYITANDRQPELKYIIEFDRNGHQDCVFYRCDNQDFVKFVESFGFKKAYGTFSDISIIAPRMKVAAVNLSSGYANAHTQHEYVSVKVMNKTIERAERMLNAECEKFEWKEVSYQKYNTNNYYQQKSACSYTQVIASPVPAKTVIVKTYLGCHENWFSEIYIDEAGNYYKRSAYGDFDLFNDVFPIDDTNPPEYDESQAKALSVFSYGNTY